MSAKPASATPRPATTADKPRPFVPVPDESIAEWIEVQHARGRVDRFELLQLTATTAPRVVEDYDAEEAGDAQAFALKLWRRAIDDSRNSIEISAIFYAVQSHGVPGTSRPGSLKKFTIPQIARTDGRPLEGPTPEGVLAGSMRHVNTAQQTANVFALEMAKQLGDGGDRALLTLDKVAQVYQRQLEGLTQNFDRQLEWKDTELRRLRERNEQLEARSLENFRLAEELHGAKFERDLAALKAGHAEERKNQVANHVIANVLPLFTKRLGGMLGGALGAAPTPAPEPAAAAADTPAFFFTPREQAAIQRFLATLDPPLLARLQPAIEGHLAEVAFLDLIRVLNEEGIKREEAEKIAEEKRNAGAPS